MTPDQWRRVKDLFAAALHIPEERRPAFLEDTCDDDAEIRSEVEKLLWEQEQNSEFLETIELHQRRKLMRLEWHSFAPGQMVAGRYRIERFIRAGGMGEVYEAFDTMLNQRVALKTVLAEMAGSTRNLERFKQEIALAREVTHPNVCRVFDVAQHRDAESGAEMLLLTMEFLPGSTLAERIKAQGRLTPAEALPLIRQMAEALAAAHDRGIVHCDFKPGNVILTSAGSAERAVVTDFGLALRVSLRPGEQTSSATAVGTPPYMAPEQFRNGGTVGTATDIYAFGITLYEMMTGKRPFVGGSVEAEAFERLHHRPEAPRALAPNLPAAWEAAILRCLENEPEKRYAAARDILRDLDPPAKDRRRWFPWAAAAVLLLLAAAALWFAGPWRASRGGAHLAVLPLTAIGSDPALQAFSDGLTETLTGRISEFQQFEKHVWVVPASEVRSAKITSAAACRRAFGVNLVITGSLQERGGILRVALNLVDAGSLRQVASRSIELPASQVAQLEDTITAESAEVLRITLSPEARRRFQNEMTQNPSAFRLYEQGMGYLRRFGRENLDQAITGFHGAIELDGNYAIAYARLGEAYQRRYASFTQNPADAALARNSVTRAAAIAPDSSTVQLALGLVETGSGDYRLATESYKRALRTDPTNGEALVGLARVYERLGQQALAEAAYKQAIAAHPDFWLPYNQAGVFYLRVGQLEQAERMFAMVAALIPDNVLGFENQAALDLILARYDQAEKALQHVIAISPSAPAYSNLGMTEFQQRRYSSAVPWFEKAVELRPNDDRLWRNLGDAYSKVSTMAAKAADAYQHAIALARKRSELNPASADAWTALALYYSKVGDRRQAILSIQESKKTARSSDLELRLAEAYEILGDRERALESLGAAIANGLNTKQVEGDQDLDRLRQDARYRQLQPKTQMKPVEETR